MKKTLICILKNLYFIPRFNDFFLLFWKHIQIDKLYIEF